MTKYYVFSSADIKIIVKLFLLGYNNIIFKSVWQAFRHLICLKLRVNENNNSLRALISKVDIQFAIIMYNNAFRYFRC